MTAESSLCVFDRSSHGIVLSKMLAPAIGKWILDVSDFAYRGDSTGEVITPLTSGLCIHKRISLPGHPAHYPYSSILTRMVVLWKIARLDASLCQRPPPVRVRPISVCHLARQQATPIGSSRLHRSPCISLADPQCLPVSNMQRGCNIPLGQGAERGNYLDTNMPAPLLPCVAPLRVSASVPAPFSPLHETGKNIDRSGG